MARAKGKKAAKAPSKAGRRPDGKFQPGVSGNPGGRPKTRKAVQEYAQLHTFEMIDIQASIARDRRAGKVARIMASKEVLAQGWGKPTQPVELTGKDGKPIESRTEDPFDLSKLSTEELKAWRGLLEKASNTR